MKLNIMTYNIEHGMDYKRYYNNGEDVINLDLCAEVINNENADIICLNEVRGKGKSPLFAGQAEIMGEKTKRNAAFSKCIEIENFGPYGDALLSAFNIDNYKIIDIPDPKIKDEDEYYETRKLFKAEIMLDKKITVFISHFGLAYSEQKNAVEVLMKELETTDAPFIFMGDLNTSPDSEVLKPIYSKMKEVYGVGGPFTYPSVAPQKKIDYIFVSNDIQINNVKTIEKVVSDHFPIVAEIEI